MSEININSFPRSGNNYARRTCERYLKSEFSISHEVRSFDGKHIALFRDPMNAVASNAYRFASADPQVKQKHAKILIGQTSDFYLKKYIDLNLDHYEVWFNKIKYFNENTMTVNFDSMSKDPKKFLNNVSTFFKIEKNGLFYTEDIKATMDRLMSTHWQEFYPRDTSDVRARINELIFEHPRAEEIRKKYLSIRYYNDILVD